MELTLQDMTFIFRQTPRSPTDTNFKKYPVLAPKLRHMFRELA